MKLPILLLILLPLLGQSCFAGLTPEQKAYLFINSRLPESNKVNFANEYDNQLSLKVANEMLQVENKKFFKNYQLVKALKQLLELQKLDSDGSFQCNQDMQNILIINNRGVGGQSCVWWPSYAIRVGIDTLIHNYCLKYAERCKDAHLQKFREIRASIQEEFNDLESILSKAIDWRLANIKSYFKVDTARMIKELLIIETISSQEKEIILKDIVNSQSIADAQAKLLDHILWPCMLYMDRLKKNELDLALHDFKVIEPPNDESYLDFFKVLANFKLCKIITENKSQFYDELVNKLEIKSS